MALDALEWGVILIMGAGILIWGPDKIPEMARTLAEVKKQFDGATKQLQGLTKELQTGLDTGNLNLDTISNALIGAGTGATIPNNPSAEEIAKATAGSPSSPGPAAAVQGAGPAAPKRSADEMLIEMARSLRIDTKGKTREEISQAIMDIVTTKPVTAPPVEPAAGQVPANATKDAQPGPAEQQTTTEAGAPASQKAA